MELIKVKHNFIGKDNQEHTCFNFYVVKDDVRICVKPTFKEQYQLLKMLATTAE